ncbi:helix-hairpin-helix domain-containing protein [Halothermothrix orenii]|uniref:Competence protein ComEA helix-hairpin-helix repeat protein n=1 Tax=Halothermothrix orenii (strain H 168 / OCM 544 / DSM 9562) TaxID=373903 RepID=B8CXM4_HALOH|nr:helix-hairpin-helix domain-containing protein [Halothermothrix orenii]ACL70043.1 competence protein ComEA helix-hairpin-helix repeat protein [Halothermothrix orenii H 168]
MSKLKKEQLLIVLFILLTIIIGTGILIYQNTTDSVIIAKLDDELTSEKQSLADGKDIKVSTEEDAEKENNETLEKEKKKIIVHVAGEVKNPGVYKLPEDARVIDAVNAAGGTTDEADRHAVNLAAPIYDGEKIVIPAKIKSNKGEDPALLNDITGSKPVSVSRSREEVNKNNELLITDKYPEKINLNRSSQEQLQKLPGIGPSKARSIVKYREENGFFTDKAQLLNVSGIGEKTYEKLKDKVSLR